jgi:pimeloyl-ACP methyl ester carboxylesterase
MGETVGRDKVRYARSGDVAVAYVVSGEGPRDIVFAHGFVGNVEIERETRSCVPSTTRSRASPGSSSSTAEARASPIRLREPATLEARTDDLRAVLDAVGSERAVLFGTVEAASMCVLFAATYPERTPQARSLQHVRHGHLGSGLPVGIVSRPPPKPRRWPLAPGHARGKATARGTTRRSARP